MKKIDLGTEKIGKLLWAFCLPCVVSMLINSIYNIVDQIFIGQGVGTLGNAATNVIFPFVIVFSAVAGLIGIGTAANMSLRLGAGRKDIAGKCVGQSITLMLIVSILLALICYILLPDMIYFLGGTETVYPYALDYGRIVLLGTPFLITYSVLSSIIRADGSPQYSMVMLIIGAVINIILDPLFIFGFNMGVKGGAWATVIGQVVTFFLAIAYLKRFKTISLEKKNFRLDRDVFGSITLGMSSFITQCTVLVLYVYMNNMMTKYGAQSVFGSDIPLSAYGIMSKINSLFLSSVLGIVIGAQPVIGFNYGAKKLDRVRLTLKRVLIINFILGVMFNLIYIFFPRMLAGMFISANDPTHDLFMEFMELMCHSFFLVTAINSLEITGSTAIQSLGNVRKATILSFLRQIILLIPISLILCIGMNMGIYGILYAGAISDGICFVIALFIVGSEYRKLGQK